MTSLDLGSDPQIHQGFYDEESASLQGKRRVPHLHQAELPHPAEGESTQECSG